MSRHLFVMVLGCVASTVSAMPPDPALVRAQTAFSQLPLRFEANRGQWHSSVKFATRTGGYTLLLTGQGPSLEFSRSQRVGISFLRSNPAAQVEALEPMPVRTSYFLGPRQNWRAEIPSYARVRYRAVYPGIDLVYYGNQNQLEYDFVLAPGAEPKSIRMQFRGANLRLTADGDLAIESGGKSILQKKPRIYQGDREVAGSYVMLSRQTVGIRLAAYDRTKQLVIDPVLAYSTYLGTSGTDQITAVKLDNRGRLYVAGWTNTAELGPTENAYITSGPGLTDTFLAILDVSPEGGYALKYLTYIGAGSLEVPYAIEVDSAYKVYVVGTTTSANFPTTSTAVQTTGAASTVDCYIVRLNPGNSGTDALEYSTYLGGASGDDIPHGIAVDKNGMIYVIGTTKSTDFPLSGSAYQSALWGPQDTFLTKIDPNSSSVAYSTYLGGELHDDGRAIAVAPNGLVYFAATTESTQFPLASSPYRTELQGGFDVIIGVMDMTRSGVDSLRYSTYFGGANLDEVRAVTFDSKNNLLLTGYTLSENFPVTADAYQSTAGGSGDAFVAAVNPLDPPRFLVYSTYVGGSGGEVGYDVKTDAAGNIYMTGYTLSPNFPTTPDASQPGWGFGIDGFLTKLKPGVAGKAALMNSTYFGGTGIYVPLGMAIGPDGSVYVGGYSGKGLQILGGGYAGGVSDGFILVIQ